MEKDKPLMVEEFIFDLPLYNVLKANRETAYEMLLKPLRFYGRVEGYNPVIKQETTYQISNERASMAISLNSFLGYNTIKATCVRTDFCITVIAIFFEDEDDTDTPYKLMKVGQFPSIADLHISKIRSYDKVLPREEIKEFTRAIGLAASGVGIGSFVYLRRVFEFLLEDAHKIALNEDGWNEEEYARARVAEKIQILKHHLPEFLVEHREMYSILSLGIHELEENDCLSHFEPLKIGIEIILDAKVDELARRKKIEEASKKIKEIKQSINKTP
jgi:hypothetical protein